MSATRRELHLNAFLMEAGHHEAAWRLPESNPRADFDLGHWIGLAKLAEDAKFDSLFLADGPALTGNGAYRPPGQLEPFTLLTALSQHTSRIGLIATVSSTYNEPYNLARRLASVDHVSGGRAGWNIVTSAGADEAANFGLDQRPDHAARYDRADEFLTVAKALWDSWEREAVHADKASGRYARRAAPTPVVAVVGLNGMTARTRLFSQIYAVAELSADDTADDPVSHRCTSTADRCRHLRRHAVSTQPVVASG
jgi:alkanesulfonate monooxygenase SsuD/methylene tetrahydromethanopterin reductase-like flavin-dependent oxidoreductase (luciferase family)